MPDSLKVQIVDAAGNPASAGGGGGGAATVADGADVTQGALANAAVTNPASSGSVIALLKGILTALTGAYDATNVYLRTEANAIFNTTPPTITNGLPGKLQIDSTGGLIVNQKPLSASLGDSITASPALTLATSQPAPLTTATTLAIARSTRTRVVILNRGSTQVYVGPATVTAANGFLLDPGSSESFTFVGLIQGISIGATGLCYVSDEYN